MPTLIRNKIPILHGTLAVACIACAFHFFGIIWVQHYYSQNIPHYDSIGTLTVAYRILGAFKSGGYYSVLDFLSQHRGFVNLSPTQAGFAAIFAPILSPEPESIQLYNSLAVFAAIAGMVIFARSIGASSLGASAFSMLFFMPDGLWWWDFGLLDYRRDAGMLGGLTGNVFLLLSLYLGVWRSERMRLTVALATGAVFGLTLLSRDSAITYVVGLLGIPVFALVVIHSRLEGWGDALRRFAAICVGAAPFVLLWLWMFPGIVGRLRDPLIAYGAGGGALASFKACLLSMVHLLAGGYHAWLANWWGYAALSIAGAGGATVLIARSWIARPEDLPMRRSNAALVLVAMSVWIFAWVLGFLALYVGWRADQTFAAHAPPLLPGLIGFYVLAAIVPMIFSLRAIALNTAALLAVPVTAMLLAQSSVSAKMRSTPPEVIEANERVARIAEKGPDGVKFAELWFRVVRVPFLGYRAAQEGHPVPDRISFVRDGKGYDTRIAAPADPAVASELVRAIDRAVRCTSTLVIVTSNLNAYEVRDSPLLLWRWGRPMVERLLQDLSDRVLATILVPHENPILILDNRDRRACG